MWEACGEKNAGWQSSENTMLVFVCGSWEGLWSHDYRCLKMGKSRQVQVESYYKLESSQDGASLVISVSEVKNKQVWDLMGEVKSVQRPWKSMLSSSRQDLQPCKEKVSLEEQCSQAYWQAWHNPAASVDYAASRIRCGLTPGPEVFFSRSRQPGG